jgi:hypothetical protein
MSLSDIIGARVSLKKHGNKYWGLCQFHDDHNPSMAVYDGDDSHYHCFSCGAHGSAIDWLMKIERLSFPEAQKKLGTDWVPRVSKIAHARTHNDDTISWPTPGVQHQEIALLRERLVQSSWSNEQVLFNIWQAAPTLEDDQLELRHPHAAQFVRSRLRKIYPKP